MSDLIFLIKENDDIMIKFIKINGFIFGLAITLLILFLRSI